MKTSIRLDSENPFSEPYIAGGVNRGRYWGTLDDHIDDKYHKKRHADTILKLVGSPQDLEILEVGSGHNTFPALTFQDLGAKVSTLCLHPDDFAIQNGIYTLENWGNYKPRKIGSFRIGNKEIILYCGDLGQISDEQSELKDKKFDVIYFWGSLHTGGNSDAIDSVSGKEEVDQIDYNQRLFTSLRHLKSGGRLIIVAEYFNQQRDFVFARNCIAGLNSLLSTDLLRIASHQLPNETVVYGLTLQRAQEISNATVGTEYYDFATKYYGGTDMGDLNRSHLLARLNEAGLKVFGVDSKENPFQEIACIDAFSLRF